MGTVSVRELRNHGGDVLERAARGEVVVIASNGRPVAELRRLPRTPPAAEQLVARRRTLPRIDVDALRSDIDAVIDPAL